MFTVESVTNLQWQDDEHRNFSCDVKYDEFNESHPTGVNATDSYAHIQELWTKGNAGVYGVIAEYVPPEIPDIVAANNQPSTSGSQNL
jgi:hypothetical protein